MAHLRVQRLDEQGHPVGQPMVMDGDGVAITVLPPEPDPTTDYTLRRWNASWPYGWMR